MSATAQSVPPERNSQSGPDRLALMRLGSLAHREAGLVLGADKQDFLIARLGPRLEHLGLGGFAAYADMLEGPKGMDERRLFIEALTTHTTSFFRERGHYDWLIEEGFAELVAQGAGVSRELVVWSAACSTGPELYSALIAAIMATDAGLPAIEIRGIGTDLSRPMVQRARQAVFTRGEIEGIPDRMRARVLLSSRNGDGRCRIVPTLRQRTDWRVANLTRPADLARIDADIVFLRNVLIYFDPGTRDRVLDNVLSRLRPGGILFTGHSETGEARARRLETIRPSIYRKDPR